ncbi:MAG: 3-dehydroquinate synthase [Candidatus Stahlbacteria bacterium]|nr:3-dehydroquinate synthase [Candidatus Stahlbacteria bacterium]
MANIVLIGFMGSGKSTIGKILSLKLKMDFADTDEMIEKEIGLPIPEIFEKYGEPYFREIEGKVVRRLLDFDNYVISTGGGTILSSENIKILRRIGFIFYLHITLQEIKKRIKDPTTRPLFYKYEKIFKQRLPIYKNSSDYTISVSKLSPSKVVEKIVSSLDKDYLFERMHINLGENGSDIYVMKRGLEKIGRYLKQYDIGNRGMIVTNTKVAKLYFDVVKGSLVSYGFIPIVTRLPDGERYKTIEYALKLYDICLKNKLDRKSFIISLGGGVVGDIAGFVSATYRRGIAFFQVSTTLLAQVDASIGGKTAVNHSKGKNMIGAFHQPRFVFSCVEVLKTLPPKEIKNGLAEVVKYGIIRDKNLFEYLEGNIQKILDYDTDSLFEIVRKSAEIKAQIVEVDEKEEGIRTILNYGHTLGHALESVGEYRRLTHGEALAIGIIYAARVSEEMGIMDSSSVKRIENLLRRIGLLTDMNLFDPAEVWRAMQLDKKVIWGKLRMVLSTGIGSCEIVDKLNENLLKKVLKSLHSNGN